MNLYLYGVGAAVLLGVYGVIVNTSNLLSERTRNLRKIGLYYSCSKGDWIEGQGGAWKYIFYLVYTLLLAPLFSWLSVGSVVAGAVLRRAKQARFPKGTVPDPVKNALLRLEQPGLTKQEVTDLLAAAREATGGEVLAEPLELKHDRTASATVNRTKKLLTVWSRTDDWLGQFTSVYEYRLRGLTVEMRLLDDDSRYPDEKIENVRDGVVMEAAVRSFSEKGLGDAEERIAELRTRTEWQQLENPLLRYYVLAQHPAEVPRTELRRALREEIERSRRAVDSVCEAARAIGLEIVETDEGYDFRYPNGAECPEATRREMKERIDAASEAAGLNSLYELVSAKQLVNDLSKWLE